MRTVPSRLPGAFQSNFLEQEILRDHLGQNGESIVAEGVKSDINRAEIPTPAMNSSMRLCAPSAHRTYFHMVVEHEAQGRGCVKPQDDSNKSIQRAARQSSVTQYPPVFPGNSHI